MKERVKGGFLTVAEAALLAGVDEETAWQRLETGEWMAVIPAEFDRQGRTGFDYVSIVSEVVRRIRSGLWEEIEVRLDDPPRKYRVPGKAALVRVIADGIARSAERPLPAPQRATMLVLVGALVESLLPPAPGRKKLPPIATQAELVERIEARCAGIRGLGSSTLEKTFADARRALERTTKRGG